MAEPALIPVSPARLRSRRLAASLALIQETSGLQRGLPVEMFVNDLDMLPWRVAQGGKAKAKARLSSLGRLFQ